VPRTMMAAPAPSDSLERFVAAPPQRRRTVILDHVLAETAKVLGLKGAGVEPHRGFFELGMDSLTSVDLRNRLGTTLQRTFATSLAFDYPTPEELTEFLLGELQPAAPLRQDAAQSAVRPGSKPARLHPEPNWKP
jgi:acyl carrier protein